MNNPNPKDEWEIDLSELEKIKNQKSDASKNTAAGFEIEVPDNRVIEFEWDQNFENFIQKQLSEFSSNISEQELKILKQEIREHELVPQEVIIVPESVLFEEMIDFASEIISESSQVVRRFKKPIVNIYELEDENLDLLISDFSDEISSITSVKSKHVKKLEVEKPVIVDFKEDLNKLISDFKSSKVNTEARKIIKKKIISKVKEAPAEVQIDEAILEKKLEDMIVSFNVMWLNHAQTRFDERSIDEDITKEEINNFVINEFSNKNLNQKQEYELTYRTKNVHTFKIVCWSVVSNIIIKTLYRIDKDSKQEYLETKNKYKK